MTPVVKLVFGADYDKTRLTDKKKSATPAQNSGDAPLGPAPAPAPQTPTPAPQN